VLSNFFYSPFRLKDLILCHTLFGIDGEVVLWYKLPNGDRRLQLWLTWFQLWFKNKMATRQGFFDSYSTTTTTTLPSTLRKDEAYMDLRQRTRDAAENETNTTLSQCFAILSNSRSPLQTQHTFTLQCFFALSLYCSKSLFALLDTPPARRRGWKRAHNASLSHSLSHHVTACSKPSVNPSSASSAMRQSHSLCSPCAYSLLVDLCSSQGGDTLLRHLSFTQLTRRGLWWQVWISQFDVRTHR